MLNPVEDCVCVCVCVCVYGSVKVVQLQDQVHL